MQQCSYYSLGGLEVVVDDELMVMMMMMMMMMMKLTRNESDHV